MLTIPIAVFVMAPIRIHWIVKCFEGTESLRSPNTEICKLIFIIIIRKRERGRERGAVLTFWRHGSGQKCLVCHQPTREVKRTLLHCCFPVQFKSTKTEGACSHKLHNNYIIVWNNCTNKCLWVLPTCLPNWETNYSDMHRINSRRCAHCEKRVCTFCFVWLDCTHTYTRHNGFYVAM